MRKISFSWLFFQLVTATSLIAQCPSPIAPLTLTGVPAVVPPPTATCTIPPTPPTAPAGYLPITFYYPSAVLSPTEIFVCILVNSSTQYLSINSGTGHATITNFTPNTYIYSPSSTTPGPQYSYPLSYFQSTGTNQYTIYIPNDGNTGVPGSNVMKSSRILISLNKNLTYFINNAGLLQLPNEFEFKDDNYYTLNDKVEYDFGSNNLNRLNLNMTGVDFIGLPLAVYANYQFFYGSSYTPCCVVTGMPSSVTLAHLFSGYTAALANLSPPFNQYWAGLVSTYTNPTGSTNPGTANIRIYAPATAMGSSQTQTNPSAISFPTGYFLNTSGGNASCSWFNAVWSGQTQSGSQAYFAKQSPSPGFPAYLLLDATTVNGSATALGYEQSDNSFNFTIQGGPDNGNYVSFPYPTSSMAFFTGAASDYKPAISTNASADTVAQVLKVFATSIISGFFPINCQYPNKIELNQAYLQNHSSSYYQNNSTLTSSLSGCSCVPNVPWYDFYSRTFLTIGSPNLFYTSAYSDFLGTDGTIVMVNPNTNNSAATVTIVINDVTTGVIVPEPEQDTTVYSAVVGIPGGATVKTATAATGPWSTITYPFNPSGNTFYLQITYGNGIYNGQTFVTQVWPSVEAFHPILPGQGAITTTGMTTNVTLGASPK